MTDHAVLSYKGKSYDLPIVVGTEDEHAADVSSLRAASGLITLDRGYGNTGSCKSEITFIDGDNGILRYRGYPIEQLAERSTFTETAYLLIFGELPTGAQHTEFRRLLNEHQHIHENMLDFFHGFPEGAPPMAILSAMINALGCFQPELTKPDDDDHFMEAAARLISKVRTIAAAAYSTSAGRPVNYPRKDMRYTSNFLHMLMSMPFDLYEPDPDIVEALDRILILHADHEQNCSTSTVRMVASSQANLHASVAAGVCALWGPLHGGANQAVIEMLQRLHDSGQTLESFVNQVKNKEAGVRLMGFGHRVYRNFDPRAKLIKESCDRVLAKLGIQDPLLDLATQLEEIALKDDYFLSRKLYPNVDFYSGIILRAIGIPQDMFTVMFAIGRLPGWIAQWREVHVQSPKIDRPRQVYIGANARDFVPVAQRG